MYRRQKSKSEELELLKKQYDEHMEMVPIVTLGAFLGLLFFLWVVE